MAEGAEHLWVEIPQERVTSSRRLVSLTGSELPRITAIREALRAQNAKSGYVIENADVAPDTSDTHSDIESGLTKDEVMTLRTEEIAANIGYISFGGI